MHAIGSAFLQTPEIAIDEKEAKLLADAAGRVAQHYNFLPDPRTQAWINLAMVAGAIYGPRIWVIMHKPASPQQEPQSQPQPQPVTGIVTPWPHTGASA